MTVTFLRQGKGETQGLKAGPLEAAQDHRLRQGGKAQRVQRLPIGLKEPLRRGLPGKEAKQKFVEVKPRKERLPRQRLPGTVLTPVGRSQIAAPREMPFPAHES